MPMASALGIVALAFRAGQQPAQLCHLVQEIGVVALEACRVLGALPQLADDGAAVVVAGVVVGVVDGFG